MKDQLKERSLLVVKGFCMGSADVVPGVSGGTMALILGIYTELIDAIKSFDASWIKAVFRLDMREALTRPHFMFLIPLFIGIIAALLFFTRVVSIPTLLKTDPELIYGLFFGLIAASVIILLREMKGVAARECTFLLAGVVAGLLVFNMVPVTTPESVWFVFMSGALAICAMVLPGISGSFILLILNKYVYIFNAIGHFQFSILVPFGLGCITGLVLFSRLLSYLLHHFYRQTIMVISGILIASFWVIWPFQERIYSVVGSREKLVSSSPVLPPEWNATVLVSVTMMIIGFIVVLGINHYASRRTVAESS